MKKFVLPALVGLLAMGFQTRVAFAGEPEVDQLLNRGDIVNLPQPLKDRLAQLIEQPHTYPAMTAFSEAANPSQLFQYYLLDQNSFQPNVFTAQIAGINDTATPPATGGRAERFVWCSSRNPENPSIPTTCTPRLIHSRTFQA
jgi:hypothetical protein